MVCRNIWDLSTLVWCMYVIMLIMVRPMLLWRTRGVRDCIQVYEHQPIALTFTTYY